MWGRDGTIAANVAQTGETMPNCQTKQASRPWLLLVTLALIGTNFGTSAYGFDMAATMPVGAWQEREEITRNAKGKETNRVRLWMGVVGEETVGGVRHLWFEARTRTYKVKRNGEVVRKGKEQAVMQTQVEASALEDFNNPMANFRKYAKKIIVQNGEGEKPMLIEGAGGLADSMMKAFGTNMDYEISDTGEREAVTTPAGTIDAQKWAGTASVEMKVLIRKIKVDSEIESWMSEDVPFGVVRQNIKNVTNGKASATDSELIGFDMEGATSSIDRAQAETLQIPGFSLPKLPKLPKLGQ